MLITRYCNLIGTANIPAVHTKTCPNTPDVFFPLPSFRRAHYTCARKIRLARETTAAQGSQHTIDCTYDVNKILTARAPRSYFKPPPNLHFAVDG